MSAPFKDELTRALAQDAFSLSLPEIGRVDGVQLAANSPCEDRFNRADSITLWESERWIAATVFDGHIGWQAADYLENNLINAVWSKLEELQPDSRTDDKIQVAIEQAFTDIDSTMINDFITHTNDKTLSFNKKVRYMEVAWSGSCALLMLYNPATKTVYTACTGDSRVVLGQQKVDALWSYEALSKDQNAENEAEIARIRMIALKVAAHYMANRSSFYPANCRAFFPPWSTFVPRHQHGDGGHGTAKRPKKEVDYWNSADSNQLPNLPLKPGLTSPRLS